MQVPSATDRGCNRAKTRGMGNSCILRCVGAIRQSHPHCASCSASDDRSASSISGLGLSSMTLLYVASEYRR